MNGPPLPSAPPPTLQHIRRELVLLRAHGGIDQERIRGARGILALRCVTAEMERSGFMDRSVAAYAVIECAVHNRIRREEYRKILLATLNLIHDGQASLPERRAALNRGGMFYSPKAYAEHEERAFCELASLLIRLQESPCDEHGQERGTLSLLAASDLSDTAIEVPVSIPLQPLISILLEVVERERSRQAVSELLDLLPNIKKYDVPGPRRFERLPRVLLASFEIATAMGVLTDFDPLPRIPDLDVYFMFEARVMHKPFRTNSTLALLSNAIERVAAIIEVFESQDQWGMAFPPIDR